MKSLILTSLLCAFFILGCGEKKVEPVQVGEMTDYRDPGYGFKIKYPKEWKQIGTTGKAVFVRSQEVSNKFVDPKTGEEGAQVIAEVLKLEGKPAQDAVQAGKESLQQYAQLSPDEQTIVSGKPAIKIPYAIKVTSKTSIVGYELYVLGDTAVYKLDLVGYGDQFGAHAGVFDAMLKSFELPIIVAKKSDEWAASPNLESYSSEYFTMQYPDNLEHVEVKKGSNDFAMEKRADRRDCSIHIDVFGAKKLTVEKVWEQNKGKYRSKGTGTTSIDGNKAFWVDYSPVANINSRAYFIVKNDKVVRTTLNWYAPQKDIYFPSLEKMATSLKLK